MHLDKKYYFTWETIVAQELQDNPSIYGLLHMTTIVSFETLPPLLRFAC